MGRLFGTDGVRGIANEELTCELALNIGRAAAIVLAKDGRRRPKIVIGADTRLSSDMLESALIAGLCSVGADVLRLGVIPTPAVAFLVGKYKADAGIMISASHNPAEFNGIKIFGGEGYKLPDELEEEIEEIVLNRRFTPPTPIGAELGKVTVAENAVRDYVDHLKSTVLFALDGMKIAVDCANGAASRSAKQLFSELNADAHILFSEPNGTNINNGCGSTHLEELSRYVVENKMDIGIAFDGDADRCLCVDENGNEVDGDQMMAICALDLAQRGKLSGNAVVGTIMTNFGFSKFCEDNGLHFVATKVGDRFVLEEMLLNGYAFGGEQSGHIIFRDFATTGDGQLSAIQLLSYLKRSGKRLSELTDLMRKYPQLCINITVSAAGKRKFYTDSAIKKAIDAAKTAFGNEGRLVVRPSGTEPLIRVMAEGNDDALVKQQAEAVAAVITERLA